MTQGHRSLHDVYHRRFYHQHNLTEWLFTTILKGGIIEQSED